MTATQPVLDICDLSLGARIGKDQHQVLVQGLSLQVWAGECLALVGESGSGKSLSAMTALGFLPAPDGLRLGGSTRVQGVDVLQLDEKSLRHIRGRQVACIFQDPGASLNPLYSIGFQMNEAWKSHVPKDPKLGQQTIRSLLERVGLHDVERILNSLPHQLSGGMQQRVAIAMALLHNPKLLIADEPTTALDVTVQAQILDLLDQLRKERGMAVLLITHHLALAHRYANRVAVMQKGQLVEYTDCPSFFKQPQHPYSLALLKAIPRLQRGQA